MNDPVAEALARVYSHGRVPMPPNMRKVLQSITPTGHNADQDSATRKNGVSRTNSAAHKDGVNNKTTDKSGEGSVGKKVDKDKNSRNSQGLPRAKTTSATSVFREFSRTSRVVIVGKIRAGMSPWAVSLIGKSCAAGGRRKFLTGGLLLTGRRSRATT